MSDPKEDAGPDPIVALKVQVYDLQVEREQHLQHVQVLEHQIAQLRRSIAQQMEALDA